MGSKAHEQLRQHTDKAECGRGPDPPGKDEAATSAALQELWVSYDEDLKLPEFEEQQEDQTSEKEEAEPETDDGPAEDDDNDLKPAGKLTQETLVPGDKVLAKKIEIAHVKMGYVYPLIHKSYPEPTAIAYCRRVAQYPIVWPNGTSSKVGPKTIMKWYYIYRDKGFDGLLARQRSDKGKSRKLDEGDTLK